MTMNKRSGKFYRKNEAEVMWELGLQPTPNSGSGWIVKEDGQSEDIICQLKSTDADSIRINKLDLDKLEYNASVAHKIPVFAIQFLKSNKIYVIIEPHLLAHFDVLNNSSKNEFDFEVNDAKELKPKKKVKSIKSSSSAREKFNEELRGKFRKEKSAK